MNSLINYALVCNCSDNSLILHSSPSGQPSLTPTPRLHLDPNRFCLGGNKAAHQGVKNTPTPWDKDYTAWGSDQNSREHGLYRPGGFRNSLPASPLSLSLARFLALSWGLSGLASMKRAWLAPARCGPFFTSGTHHQPLKQPLVFRNRGWGVKAEGAWQQ